MDPATLSVDGAEVGSAESSIEKAEGAASVVGSAAGAGAGVELSSHEGVSPSILDEIGCCEWETIASSKSG